MEPGSGGKPALALIAYNRMRAGRFHCPRREGDQILNRFVLRTILLSLALTGLVVPCRITTQEPANRPETMAPAAQTTPAAASMTAAEKAKAHEEQVKNDWPWLGRFKEADQALGAPAAGENRVVFMGDSITEGWQSGRVVSRQALHQSRHQRADHAADGAALPPGRDRSAAEGGGDSGRHERHCRQHRADDAGGDGRTICMAWPSWRTANHIKVVLCSIMPAFDYPWHAGTDAGAEDRRAERLDQGLRGGQGLRVRGLPHGDEGRARRAAGEAEQGRGASDVQATR